MKKPVVFMFSGQGSQYFHMGKELYQNNKRFALWMNHCNELVQPLIGQSLIDIIYDESLTKGHPFNRILHSNPALLCFEYSLARVLMESDIYPDYLLGYSLGEFCSCVLAGVISLENACEMVVDFGKVLEQCSAPAGMLAIMDSEQIMLKNQELFHGCWLASRNFSNNFVVSGSEAKIDQLQKKLVQQNIASQKLSVKYGFHTCMMDPMEKAFYAIAKKINYHSPTIPIISMKTGLQIDYINEDYLWKVIRECVEFESTVKKLMDNGDYIFIDVGPSGTLSTFVKYLSSDKFNSVTYETINPFGRDLQTLEKLKSASVMGFIDKRMQQPALF